MIPRLAFALLVCSLAFPLFAGEPEVLVDGATYKVIRRRETYEDLIAAERV